MKLLDRILAFFLRASEPPKRQYPLSRPKFVEGTEWTCPNCGTTLGIAKRDIYSGSAAFGRQWGVPSLPKLHCGVPTMRRHGGRDEIHTPTGWVG